MNKKFLPAYSPATLIQAKDRWYICFYAPTEQLEEPTRYRLTFNINRIKDRKLRKERGDELAAKINWWLRRGLHAWNFDERKIPPDYNLSEEEQKKNTLGDTNIIEALEFIRDVKEKTGARDTARTYRSQSNLLIEFLKLKKFARISISDFTKSLAMAYLDHRATIHKISNTTYNNTITNMRVIFNALIDREYMEYNPFKDVPKKKASEKRRRSFSDIEAVTVIHRIRKESRLLFYALLLEYTCFMRPEEIRCLRFKDINLQSGVVTLREHTKTKQQRHTTIPDDFIPFFDHDFFNKYPGHFYIFGDHLEPHPSKKCSSGALYRQHKKILEDLRATGALNDIIGLQFYSWKDTGITYALEEMKILAVQDQAGHSTPQMTLRYREKPKVNREMKTGFKNKLIHKEQNDV